MMRGRELDLTWIEEGWQLDLCRTAASPQTWGSLAQPCFSKHRLAEVSSFPALG